MLTAGAHLSNLPDFSSGGFSSSPYGTKYAPVATFPAGSMVTVPAWASTGLVPAGQAATGGTTPTVNPVSLNTPFGTLNVSVTPATPTGNPPAPPAPSTTPSQTVAPSNVTDQIASLQNQLAAAQSQVQQMQPVYANATDPANVVSPIWMLVAGGVAAVAVGYLLPHPKPGVRPNPTKHFHRFARKFKRSLYHSKSR